jgi:16S rRNA (uracil1498-N3)-methyltransferase
MSERFFVEAPITGNVATLTGDEAHHLSRVMRAAVGDELVLFDGSGAEFSARITQVGKSAALVQIIERREIDREGKCRLTLAAALPKGERQKWLVEKATELGVFRIVPLITERGVAQPVEAALVRLRRAVIEASKQCGRNRLLEIAEPADAAAFFAAAPEGTVRLLADPSGMPLTSVAHAAVLIAAIGPEGGFTPAEVAAAAECGWQLVSLGKSILRVETAAIAVASWGALG